MALTFRGFWSPDAIYGLDDVVEYYFRNSDDTVDYALTQSYRCKLSFTPNSSPSSRCPLLGYTLPPDPSSGSSENRNLLYIHLHASDLYAVVNEGGSWADHRYYDPQNWTGPHGADGLLQESNWEAGPAAHADWSDLSKYKIGGQTFSSDGLTTYSSDKYGGEAGTCNIAGYDTKADCEGANGVWTVGKEVSFDEVQGETDSDSYYISSVQNYKGDYSSSDDYKRFDIVREPKSHLFYYARRAINAVESADIAIKDFSVGPPSYVSEGSHVGTVEYSDDKVFTYSKISGGTEITSSVWEALSPSDPEDGTDWQGLYVGDQFNQRFSIGDIVDLSALTKPANKNTYTVLGISEMDMFLGTFGAVSEGDVMAAETHVGPKFFKKESSEVTSTTPIGEDNPVTNQIWSYEKFFFDADYGSTVSFTARNKQYQYGDGYKSVAPLGVNSIRMEFDLSFSNRSNREANAILHFLENKLGQHETREESYFLAYDQGISGFRMDDEALFFPYNNAENLTKRFYSFGFEHKIENEDVHTVKASIINTTSSTLNVAEGIFVNPAPAWDATETYTEHSVVFCPDNQKYYYSYSENPHSSFRPCLPLDGGWQDRSDHDRIITNHEYEQLATGVDGRGRYEPFASRAVVSINEDIWTREFYWKPSIDVSLRHDPAITEFSSKASPYSQYYPAHKQNINPLKFQLKFENRSDEEAYAILHFLESRLGYKSFLFVPPAPYNRKRRFFCESWSHTYVFRNNHTIAVTFEQFPLGLNTPLSEDQIDNIAPKVNLNRGTLSVSQDLNFKAWQLPSGDKTQHLKRVLTLRNTGETGIRVPLVPASSVLGEDGNPSSKFSLSLTWGKYKSSVEITSGALVDTWANDKTYGVSVSSSDSLGGGVPVIYQNADENYFYSQTSNGEVTKLSQDLELLENSGTCNITEHTDKDACEAANGAWTPAKFPKNKAHNTNLLERPAEGIIAPGEEFFLEVYFNTLGAVSISKPGSVFGGSISIPYHYDASSEKPFDSEEAYETGNIVQYDGKVYKRKVDGVNSLWESNDWEEVSEVKLVSLEAVVNPELYDEKKKEITFSIDRPGVEEIISTAYDVQDNIDNITSFIQGGEDKYQDLVLNASSEGSALACPTTLEGFELISGLEHDLDGYLFLGVIKSEVDLLALNPYDGASDYASGDEVSSSGSAWRKVGDQVSGVHSTPSEGADWTDVTTELVYRNFYNSEAVSILRSNSFVLTDEDDPELLHLALHTSRSSTGLFQLKFLSKNSPEAVGHVREVSQISQSGSVNISNEIQSSGALSGIELEDVRKVTINLTGVFFGKSNTSPAVELGGGWGETAEIELNIGSISNPCLIIGRGGGGGTGMMTEGVLYENGDPSLEQSQMSPPTSGGKGGDALSFSSISNQIVKVNFINGSVYAGGGGGGGGGYSGMSQRSQTSFLLNFGGGGGGGAGHGAGAFPRGSDGPLDINSGGQAAAAINNSSVFQSSLGSGGNGGVFGAPGGAADEVENATHKILGKGGGPGRAITWDKLPAPPFEIVGCNYAPANTEEPPWDLDGYDEAANYDVNERVSYSARTWKKLTLQNSPSHSAPGVHIAEWEDVTGATFKSASGLSPDIAGECGQRLN
jgi:phage-related protein